MLSLVLNSWCENINVHKYKTNSSKGAWGPFNAGNSSVYSRPREFVKNSDSSESYRFIASDSVFSSLFLD